MKILKVGCLNFTDGFAFSQEEGGAVSQSDVVRVYDTKNKRR
jgi:hypothetical protein